MNIIVFIYTAKLDIKVQKTNVRVQKITTLFFEKYKVILASFWVKKTLGWS